MFKKCRQIKQISNLKANDDQSVVTPPVCVLTLKRLEAFRVLQVNVEEGGIFLDENPLLLNDIWEFETRFNEAKLVQSAIYSVADDMKMDLNVKQIYFRRAFKL